MQIADIRWHMPQGPNGPKTLQIRREVSEFDMNKGYGGVYNSEWENVRIQIETENPMPKEGV